MGAIGKLWNAFANLAASLNALAGTVTEANGRLRASLALDGPQDTPAGPTPTVIENAPTAPPGALPGPRRNGRKATA